MNPSSFPVTANRHVTESLSVAASSSSTPEMSLEERFRIVRSIGEECIQDDELLKLLKDKPHPICYDGFEPSGKMHIAQGVMKIINVNKLTSAGCHVKIWIADLFAKLNNKMGGDLDKIRPLGEYFIEIWKAAGMTIDAGNIEFLWSSDEIISRSSEYLPLVWDIASRNKLLRIKRCCQIMGRKESDELTAAQIFYPCMQCADIFFLKADICQLGMDQRKVNVLAREYCDDIERKNKPIILSHHMLPGLQQGQEKMSKSDPSSSIFMDDEEDAVIMKIDKAYCPPKIVEGNPCLEYIKYIIFPWFNEFKVERKPENGGEKTFLTFAELVPDYENEGLHPADLKPALSKALNKILQSVRDHFKNDAKAADILKRVELALQLVKEQQTPPTQELKSLSVAASSSSTPEMMSPEERFRIVRSIGEECMQDEDLLKLLKDNPNPICYDGFEPSGRMHIAQGVMKAINVNKLTSAGCHVKIWIADWFAKLNNKVGGDLAKIRKVGEYLIEVWKAVGMNFDAGNIEFLWCSDEINSKPSEYLALLMDVACRNTLPRIISCCEIMGRNESDELTAAQIFYPCMQCADVFFLKADICQMGMDQREVNVLAREYCDDIKREDKPIILSHHMLPGLQQGQEKMSTSDPTSCIFMDDEEVDVNKKIRKAYCPPKIVEGNPCLDYLKHIIFPWFNEFKVERKPENGGEKTFHSFEELVTEYENGGLHPADLKPALSKALNKILQPVRDHFKNDAKAKELFKLVKSYRVTK